VRFSSFSLPNFRIASQPGIDRSVDTRALVGILGIAVEPFPSAAQLSGALRALAVQSRASGDQAHVMNASLPIADRGAGQLSSSAKLGSPVSAATHRKRHSALVRATHWIATVAVLALLVSGGEIVLSHPRFYWGETGNVNMRPWLNLHLPSSRHTVPTGYGYVLPDQNGWSRYLHFQAAWLVVGTGLFYVLCGFFGGHFRRDLFPAASDLSIKELGGSLVRHLRFERPSKEEAWSYNVLQRLTYLLVIFVLFPLMIWTGLAMSMGFTSAFPLTVRLLGGQQTARTLHFLVTILIVLFMFVHVLMVFVAGFRNRMRAMITGRANPPTE
jgi:thiosulfate reductase cytochrome b subunit